jgi:uncharacterized membrane protein
MVLSKREPVNFGLFVRNDDDTEKKLTVKVILPSDLAFTKGGFKTTELLRVDSIMPREEKTFYFELYPRHNTQAGEKEIRVIVQEHKENYQYTQNQFERIITFIVED